MGDQEPEDFDDFFRSSDDEPAAEPAEEPRRVPPRLGVLAELSQEEFDTVARSAQLKFLPAGQQVFAQGDEADRFFILVDGRVRVERDGDQLATLGPGSFFGESALLLDGHRSATVSTVEDSALWSVSYLVFDEVVSRHLLADEEARRQVHERLPRHARPD